MRKVAPGRGTSPTTVHDPGEHRCALNGCCVPDPTCHSTHTLDNPLHTDVSSGSCVTDEETEFGRDQVNGDRVVSGITGEAWSESRQSGPKSHKFRHSAKLPLEPVH